MVPSCLCLLPAPPWILPGSCALYMSCQVPRKFAAACRSGLSPWSCRGGFVAWQQRQGKVDETAFLFSSFICLLWWDLPHPPFPLPRVFLQPWFNV